MNMQNEPQGEPKKSNAKKWIIGCGGCLVVVLLIAGVLAVLGGTAVKGLMDASSQSVQSVFGKSYKAEGYTAIGLPTGSKDLKNVVLLMDMTRGSVIVAVDTRMSAADAGILKSGNTEQIQAYIQKIGEQANTSPQSSSSNVDLHDMRFDDIHTVKLPNGKQLPVTTAAVKANRKGQEGYSPAVIALLPEPGEKMIVLFAMDAKSTSSNPKADFKVEQQALETQVLELINNSELDDRLQ